MQVTYAVHYSHLQTQLLGQWYDKKNLLSNNNSWDTCQAASVPIFMYSLKAHYLASKIGSFIHFRASAEHSAI